MGSRIIHFLFDVDGTLTPRGRSYNHNSTTFVKDVKPNLKSGLLEDQT
ncbi:hypothetical protein Ocin01_12645 [Orchesella cincta]|uniref:Uncharacterized protein n=1 Tax=Orchesella cincta TaxID=48709 RepID=A0A1D2MMD5_ORCCI|nr:hypothetical protein Ocin01_12645 [Orchesella cincta]